jgi:DNA-binding MarR family transcriptional regulator
MRDDATGGGQDWLFFRFKHAHHQLSLFAARRVAEATGVPAAQVAALVHLQRRDRVLVRELGDQLWLNSAGITGLVTRLEQAGHVRRVPNPHDRRGVIVQISRRGRDIARRVGPILEEISQQMTFGLTTAQVATVEAFLDVIVTTFDTASPAPSRQGRTVMRRKR